MKFFQAIFSRREKEAAAKAAELLGRKPEYLNLIGRVAADENLNAKDAARLEALLVLLGISVEQSEQHALALRQVRELTPAAGDIDALRAAYHKKLLDLEISVAEKEHELKVYNIATKQLSAHGTPNVDFGAREQHRNELDSALGAYRLRWQDGAAAESQAYNAAVAAHARIDGIKAANPYVFVAADTDPAKPPTSEVAKPAPKRATQPAVPIAGGNQWGAMSE